MNAERRDRAGRVLRITVMALAPALVAACSMSSGSAAPPPSAPPGGAVIVAQDQHFDRSRLDLPAGVDSSLLLENRDAAPHNVAIADASGAPMFAGEIFGGIGSRTYAIPALAAGTYSFRCDVHPDMHGSLVVAPVTAGT